MGLGKPKSCQGEEMTLNIEFHVNHEFHKPKKGCLNCGSPEELIKGRFCSKKCATEFAGEV